MRSNAPQWRRALFSLVFALVIDVVVILNPPQYHQYGASTRRKEIGSIGSLFKQDGHV